jgi:hypothetical protein
VILLLVATLVRKRFDLKQFGYSLVTWHMTTLALILGFLETPQDINNFNLSNISVVKP